VTTAFTTIDLDGQGKAVGFVMIPHSPHEDAWGVSRVPIAVIANGRGPTVILEAGNHGDEYEGQIVICEMIRDVTPSEIQGRLILLPASNVHAVMAGTRTSPMDGLNLNRSFPGDSRGTITRQIAAFVANELFTRGNAFLDLHSGGSSLDLLPSVSIEPSGNAELRQRNIAAGLAFDAPLTVVIGNLGEPATATATACRAGLVTVATELGGGGAVSFEGLEVCRRGVRNVLAHLGVLPPDKASKCRGDGRVLELPGTAAFVYAGSEGVFEPFHEKGRQVRAGDAGGRVHCTWDPTRTPETLYYQADGLLYGRRQPGRVRPGNCCLVVAASYGGVL
jgi:predicted deacylase